jgi:hypothetical protein
MGMLRVGRDDSRRVPARLVGMVGQDVVNPAQQRLESLSH